MSEMLMDRDEVDLVEIEFDQHTLLSTMMHSILLVLIMFLYLDLFDVKLYPIYFCNLNFDLLNT